MSSYNRLNAIPSLLFAGAYYLAWTRVNRAKSRRPRSRQGCHPHRRRRSNLDRASASAGVRPAGSLFLRDHVGHEELLAVVVERERIVIVVHPPHLHAPQAELDFRLADLDLAEVEDAVGEEVLPPLGEPRRAERRLRDQEGREAELLEGTEEMEHLPPVGLEVREGVQRLEAVDREDLVAARIHGLLHDLDDDREPVLRALGPMQPAAELTHVQDVHGGLVQVAHAHA